MKTNLTPYDSLLDSIKDEYKSVALFKKNSNILLEYLAFIRTNLTIISKYKKISSELYNNLVNSIFDGNDHIPIYGNIQKLILLEGKLSILRKERNLLKTMEWKFVKNIQDESEKLLTYCLEEMSMTEIPQYLKKADSLISKVKQEQKNLEVIHSELLKLEQKRKMLNELVLRYVPNGDEIKPDVTALNGEVSSFPRTIIDLPESSMIISNVKSMISKIDKILTKLKLKKHEAENELSKIISYLRGEAYTKLWAEDVMYMREKFDALKDQFNIEDFVASQLELSSFKEKRKQDVSEMLKEYSWLKKDYKKFHDSLLDSKITYQEYCNQIAAKRSERNKKITKTILKGFGNVFIFVVTAIIGVVGFLLGLLFSSKDDD